MGVWLIDPWQGSLCRNQLVSLLQNSTNVIVQQRNITTEKVKTAVVGGRSGKLLAVLAYKLHRL